MFRESPDGVEKFFSYFENVATGAKSFEHRAVKLIGLLAGEALDFYYEYYPENSEF